MPDAYRKIAATGRHPVPRCSGGARACPGSVHRTPTERYVITPTAVLEVDRNRFADAIEA